jgi:hypothetical protein
VSGPPAPAASRAGFDELTFHARRHAGVSALVDEGVHPDVRASRARHGTVSAAMRS